MVLTPFLPFQRYKCLLIPEVFSPAFFTVEKPGSNFFPQVLTFYNACSAGNGKCMWQLPSLLQPGCSDLDRLSAIETVHGWSCDRPGVSRKMFVSPCSSCIKQGEQAVRSREQFPAHAAMLFSECTSDNTALFLSDLPCIVYAEGVRCTPPTVSIISRTVRGQHICNWNLGRSLLITGSTLQARIPASTLRLPGTWFHRLTYKRLDEIQITGIIPCDPGPFGLKRSHVRTHL
jgi:hypothetical protein